MIVSTATLKSFLKITSSEEDSLIESISAAAQQMIESQCDRSFELDEVKEIFDGDGENTLFLSNPPIVSITSVMIDDIAKTASEYGFNKKNGEIWNKNDIDFAEGRQNVVIVSQSGFSESDMPADIKQAILELSANMYKKGRQSGVSSQSIGDFSVTFDTDSIPTTVQSVVEKYRFQKI